ncbi:MAG: hypothetical protein FJX67_11335 [Alphaproteobacteria bacterium]|nr:hypothetical protein [Alphaproteobacteria bacterium]
MSRIDLESYVIHVYEPKESRIGRDTVCLFAIFDKRRNQFKLRRAVLPKGSAAMDWLSFVEKNEI